MFQRTKICSSLLVAFGSILAVNAFAQDAVQRVEITGSSIKRINAESALPVQVITADDIKKTGVTTVTDLLQQLPAMQGFTTSSQSVNGGGGGATTASIHDIGEQYTLVLLNGHRLAPYTTGTTVNLNSIPLAAIERVEVLTDGASAVYGADAIAGVVNFILKKDATDGEFTASGYLPQHKGGGSASVSISKGFGDLNKDKFNVLLAASFDKQQKLDASQRPFSKTGFIPFTYNGQHVTTFLSSSNSIPGNVILNGPGANYPEDPTDIVFAGFFSPYQMANGTCPAKTVLRAGVCRFDYASTVESVPDSKRVSLFGSARFNVSDALSLSAELAFSRFSNSPRYAPPAQPGIFLTDALYQADVVPYLADLGLTEADVIGPGDPNFNGPTMNLRVYDAGGRQDKYQYDSLHFVLGADGTVGAVDYKSYFTHSQTKFSDTAAGGYMSSNKFNEIVAGGWDPLTSGIGTSQAILAPGVLHSSLDESKSSIDMVGLQGSTTLFKLSGGDAQIAVGGEYMHQRYKDDPSLILQGVGDTIIGGGGGALPFDSARNSIGIFSELSLPITKQLDLSASVRYDSFGQVKNSNNFNVDGSPAPDANQGKKNSSPTWKLSARLQPTKEFLLRASYGTGFKAPTLAQITSPLAAAGVTGTQDCPFVSSDPLAAYCRPFAYEYNQQAGGNPFSDASGLKPEHSQQWTIGTRLEPGGGLSAGFDLWDVRLRDQIGTIPEDVAFSDGAAYHSLFKIAPDPITGQPQLTFISSPTNTGHAHYQGLDFDVENRSTSSLGKLKLWGHMTYMLRADYEIPGAGMQNSMGKLGPDGAVTFRWIASLGATLESGAFTHTLTGNFKPGYADSVATSSSGPEIRIVNPDGTIGGRTGVVRNVGSYNTFDWQTRFAFSQVMGLTVGLKNMFDTKPPFTIQDTGGTGNARGFDGRYTDPIGRQFYLAGNYKF